MNGQMVAHFAQLDEAQKGSDRVSAIVYGAAVHDALKEALICVLLKREEHAGKLLSPDGPLGNWGIGNDLAHSIGVISDDVWHDLDCVRRIRNKFAHWGTVLDSTQMPKLVTFSTDHNRDRALSLKCPEILPRPDTDDLPRDGSISLDDFTKLSKVSPTDPRKRFELTCDSLIHLCGRMRIHYSQRNPELKEFDFPILLFPGS